MQKMYTIFFFVICLSCSIVLFLRFTDKGKESFLEGEGVTILRMVLEESDDDELIDLGFEIITSLILDGKLCFCSWQWLLKSFLMSGCKKKWRHDQSTIFKYSSKISISNQKTFHPLLPKIILNRLFYSLGSIEVSILLLLVPGIYLVLCEK